MHIMIITDGVLECTLNQSHIYVSPSSLAIMPESSVIHKIETSNDFKGYLISLDKSLLESMNMDIKTMIVWRKSSEPFVKRITKKDIRTYKLYVNLIQDSMNKEQNDDEEVIWLLVRAFCCNIFRDFQNFRSEEIDGESHTRKDSLSKQFISLVQEHAIEHKDLSFYADKLCVTPKYLSNVISKTTGKKAAKWIDYYVMLQAMRLLKNTEDNISQISDKLNFMTSSDFCRCFKRMTGMTPKQYRRTV